MSQQAALSMWQPAEKTEQPLLTKLKLQNDINKSAPLDTFGRSIFPARRSRSRPRKFDQKGRRSPEWDAKLSEMTPLQRHAAYFLPHPDADKIYPTDTFRSVRAWGWGILLTFITTAIVHLALAYFTQPSYMWWPNPLLPCYMANMHRAKHGSDSGAYNTKGAFKRALFDDFFDNYDQDKKGGLTALELFYAWHGQRYVLDPYGWCAAAFEWTSTYLLLWPDDGVLKKQDAEGVFDGEMLWRAKELEDERRIKRGLRPRVY